MGDEGVGSQRFMAGYFDALLDIFVGDGGASKG